MPSGTRARPESPRTGGKGGARKGGSRPAWKPRTRLGAAYDALTAWLTRPLASFHLVLATFGLLTVFGLVMVLSASSVDSFSEDGSSYTVFGKQLAYVSGGLLLFYLALRIPPRVIRRWSLPAFGLCLLLLLFVLTPLGTKIHGARSWFTLGSVSFQPVELVKVSFALWGAHVLVTKRALLNQWRHLLVPVVPAALLMFALVMLQPDYGSTAILVIVLLALLWFTGAPLRLFGALTVGAGAAAGVLALTASYRSDRIQAFLHPELDPTGNGYQVRQALYALADGGLFGQGLGQGWSKWRYLPMGHSDFIFAVIGEELGLLGCVALLGLFGTAGYVGIRIAQRNRDPWIRLVAATLTTWLVAQAAINIAYVVGLLPVTGLPLPLISSGGSSVVTTMIAFGLLANFARHEPEAIAALRSLGPGRVGKLLRLPTPEPYRPPKRRSTRPTSASRKPARSGAGTSQSPSGADRRQGRRGGAENRGRTAPPRGAQGQRAQATRYR